MELFQRKVDKRKAKEAQMADSPGEGSDKSITYEGGAAAQRKGANTPNKRTSKNGADPFGTKTKPSEDGAPKPMNKGGMAKKKVMTYNIGGMVKSQINNLKKGKN